MAGKERTSRIVEAGDKEEAHSDVFLSEDGHWGEGSEASHSPVIQPIQSSRSRDKSLEGWRQVASEAPKRISKSKNCKELWNSARARAKKKKADQNDAKSGELIEST